MSAETVLTAAAFSLYLAGGLAALAGLARRGGFERAVLPLLGAAVALHAAALGFRWARVGTGPFITMHEVLSSNVWSLAFVYVLAAWRLPVLRPMAGVVMPVIFTMMAWMMYTDPTPGHQPATYRTAWLYVHVALGKVFLGCLLVAVGISGAILLRGARATLAGVQALPDDTRLERLAFRFMVVGFLFESLMLVAGAIWAQDAWGRYWAWDPLETWAFVTWLALAAFIHARVSFAVTPRAGALMVVGVFAIAFLTFFGVPFVSTAPHKGAL